MLNKSINFILIFSTVLIIRSFGQTESTLFRIDSIRSEMVELVRKNRISAISEFYGPDAIMNGYDGVYTGKKEISEYWKNIRGKGNDWKWQIFSYSGNDNYIIQTGKSHFTLEYGDRIITHSSLFSVVWEKQNEGSFKIVSDFYRPTGRSLTHKYPVELDSVYIVSGKDSIFGILFKPDIEKKQFPAVLCLQGGGDVGLSNYFYEARYLAENGFMTLVCDKSGAGLSSGTGSWISQTFEEKTEEYEKLLNWLIRHPSVDPEKTGVHGLSEGGRLALDMAIRNPDKIAFVNSVSAPVESFKENQLFAIQNFLYQRNYRTTTIIEALSLWNRYFDSIAASDISGELMKEINTFRNNKPGIYLPGNSRELPRRPRPEDIYYSNEDKLDQIQCPVFLQYGDKDQRVDVSGSVSLMPDQNNISITIYEDTDHAMQLSGSTVHPEYLSDKVVWLKTLYSAK